MSKPKVLLPFSRVIHVVYPDQETLAKKFMRLQEFYESALPGFRGRHFTREEFKKAYAKDRGIPRFTYYTDWAGFNVPGRVVNKFMKVFTPDPVECNLLKLIDENKPSRGRYYVIGTYHSDHPSTIEHELSHAFWELDSKYRSNAERLITSLPLDFYGRMIEVLREVYCQEVLDDEVTAYLSTGTMTDLVRLMGDVDLPWHAILRFQQNFRDHILGKKLGKK